MKQNRLLILVTAAVLAAAAGVYWTGRRPAQPTETTTGRRGASRNIVVDQTSLITAEALVRAPMTAEERPFAQDALRIADNEMDLSFAAAVRRIANQPRDTTEATREADARLKKALLALTTDRARVDSLTEAASKATPVNAQALTDQLNIAKAQAALDRDEVDDARLDLRRAGGDPQGRMEEMLEEHAEAATTSDSLLITIVNPADVYGLVHHIRALIALSQKKSALRHARSQSDSLAAVLKERHDRVEARSVARLRNDPTARVSHDSANALIENAQRLAREGTIRAALDRRIDNQHALANVYTGWISAVGDRQRDAVHRALRGVLTMLIIILVAILLGGWIERLLGRREGRVHTHHLAVRVSLQVVATILIALVFFGPPNNVGTMVGLTTAGLTVALKDFIVGFMGWFVLLGRNGIRIGDLVEIKGVTGEVVELGVFRTVLLETRPWTEAGNPTGRRVTFNNSFAIEGHYFNFSTSGRWLWDEVRIVVPAGRDPYPIAAALQKHLDEATAESVREAEEQWSAARRSPQSAPSAGASVSLRPIIGGVEIVVRYITRVTEREEFRARLYRTAVDMLEGVAHGSAK